MPRPASGARSDPILGLPVIDRLAPPPPAAAIAAVVDALTAPGDIVVDLAGRGGWIARVAHARRRKAISLEADPLARLAAEIVLRPPDLRHLDATVAAIGARAVGETSLRLAAADHFRTRCRRCGRRVVAEDVVWRLTPARADPSGPGAAAEARGGGAEPEPTPTGRPPSGAPGPLPSGHPWSDAAPVEVRYRCPACGPGAGARDPASAPVDEDDRRLAARAGLDGAAAARAALRERFAVDDRLPTLPDELLDLASPRQLVMLAAVLDAIEEGLRAPAIDAALRFALLGAIQQAGRTLGLGGRPTALRLVGGRVRLSAEAWRERNPWLAFETGIRVVRGVVQRLEADDPGAPPARFGEDVRALVEGPATAVVRLATPAALVALTEEVAGLEAEFGRSPIRLAVVEAPPVPSPDRLLAAYHAVGWILGREAVRQLPLEVLAAGGVGGSGWPLVALRRSLEGSAGLLTPDGRAVVVVRGLGLEPLAGAAVAASRAGYRLAAVDRHSEPEAAWTLELEPPQRGLAPSAAARPGAWAPAIRPDPWVPASPATDESAPPGVPSLAERPFSRSEALRTVVDASVAVLKSVGEPVGRERLVGPLLVALDRSGHLRRAAVAEAPPAGVDPARPAAESVPPRQPGAAAPPSNPSAGGLGAAEAGARSSQPPSQPLGQPPSQPRPTAVSSGTPPAAVGTATAVETIVSLLEAAAEGGASRRLAAIGGELWLADPGDRAAAADPISDRIEWAVLTFLATAAPAEPERVVAAVEERLGLRDPLDRALVRACLASYAVPAGDGRLVAARDDLVRRANEHTRVLARLVELGHALGFNVWLPARERTRRHGGGTLEALLGERERRAHLGVVLSAPTDALEALDLVWYVRSRAVFLFEVEWTAMLAGPVLRRGPLIPTDERIVRFVVLAPERRALARAKLERSAFLRATLEADNWHILLWDQLEAFAALRPPSLAALEPYLGLDPPVERPTGDQLPLFEGGPPGGRPDRPGGGGTA